MKKGGLPNFRLATAHLAGLTRILRGTANM